MLDSCEGGSDYNEIDPKESSKGRKPYFTGINGNVVHFSDNVNYVLRGQSNVGNGKMYRGGKRKK